MTKSLSRFKSRLKKKKSLKKEAPPKRKIEGPKVDFPTVFIKNSFCTLAGFPDRILKIVEETLTYENEDIEHELRAAWNLSKYFKSKGNRRGVYAMRSKIEALEAKRVVCWFNDNQFPTGHLSMILDLFKELRFNDFKIEDCRKLPQNFSLLRWRNPPDENRYYQNEMIALGEKHGRGVFESAVGTGKTNIMMGLVKAIGVNSLIVLPSSGLLDQTSRKLTNAFGKHAVCSISTKAVKSGKKMAPIRLATIQTLASLMKSGLLMKVLRDVDAIFIDEFHHSGAESFTALLPELDHVYYRFGFTGTFMRNDHRTLDMWGFLSNRLYHYPPFKATEEGFLTPVKMLVTELEGEGNKDYAKEYKKNYCGGPELLGAIRALIRKIPKDEQILILVDQKDGGGKIIHELLESHGIDNTYISGDDKKEVIGDTIESFNKKEIRILVGSKVIGEGIDVHSAQHLILANGGKSPIKLVQAIGRCVRLHPGKKKSYVYDFQFRNTNYLEKHLGQRVETFREHFAGEVEWIQ